jgi:hypothetical protein
MKHEPQRFDVAIEPRTQDAIEQFVQPIALPCAVHVTFPKAEIALCKYALRDAIDQQPDIPWAITAQSNISDLQQFVHHSMEVVSIDCFSGFMLG